MKAEVRRWLVLDSFSKPAAGTKTPRSSRRDARLIFPHPRRLNFPREPLSRALPGHA